MSDFDTTLTDMPEMPMATNDITEEYFSHIKKINDVFYDQLKIADQKAAYIFTFMLAFLVSSGEGRSVFTWSRYTEGSPLMATMSAFLAVSSVFSILCAIIVVLPRHVDKSTSLFWGTWPKHRPDFELAAQRSDIGYLFHQYIDNADVLSTIARQKYRCVGLAFRGLVITVIAYVLLLAAA